MPTIDELTRLYAGVPLQQQATFGGSAVPPQYIQDSMAQTGVAWDPARWAWDPDTMNIIDRRTGAQYWQGGIPDPSLGTNVVMNGQTTNYQGNQPVFFGFPDGGDTFVSNDPAAIAQYNDDRRSRVGRGVLQVGALVGGAAALGALGGGSSGGSNALTGVSVPSSVTPTGAAVGALGPSVPATAGAAAIGPTVGAGTAGAIGASMPNWVNWANLGSTVLGLYGAERAADAQVGASNAAISESRRQFDTARQDLMPAIELGGTAATTLRKYLSGDQSVFTSSPEYQFNIEQARKESERRLGAMGLRDSGPAVREAGRYASGLASRESGAFVDRLLAAAGLGTTGATASANAGANSAAMVGNAAQNAGAARASGYANQYGALQGGLNNLLLQRYLGV